MSADSRTTLARHDLADAALEGIIPAQRYAATTAARVIAPSAALRAQPARDGEQVDQLLFGEIFEGLDAVGDFVWGRARRDGYVGFVERACLAEAIAPSHWVAVRATFGFAEPRVRALPFGPISMGALVSAQAQEGTFVQVRDAGWIPAAHLLPLGRHLDDPAGVAALFIGAPYLWGGRAASGLDCSGLVQQALIACAMAAPRDADQQAELGRPGDPGRLERGDLVAWKGHIGLMLDDARLIHANAHHMAVAIEPLAEAVARIASSGSGKPTAFRRLGPP